MGETAVPTGSQGGTMGWMSPEEIEWDNGGSARGVAFQAHLSGDIHTAGSIVYYVLSGGVHCFGQNNLRQQLNIIDGTADFGALEGSDTIAVDLVARMVRRSPTKRLKISQVADYPLFWSDMQRIEKIRGWRTSWRRGRDLDRRLAAHADSMNIILGGGGGRGWLGALDKEVADRLSAWEDGRYDGNNVLDLIRAIRNAYEHWFETAGRAELPADAMRALTALTGWSEAAEMRKGRASSEAQGMQAMAVSRYFLSERRFAALLLVFEFARAWSSE